MFHLNKSLALLILGLAVFFGVPLSAQAQLVSLGPDTASQHFPDHWADANRPLLRPHAVAAMRARTVRPSDRSVFDGGPVRYGLVNAADASRIVTATELLCANRTTGSLLLGCRTAAGRNVNLRLSARTCANARSIRDLLPRGCTDPFTVTVEGREVLIRRVGRRNSLMSPPSLVVGRHEPGTPPPSVAPPPGEPPVPRQEARQQEAVITTVSAPRTDWGRWPWIIGVVALAALAVALLWQLAIRPQLKAQQELIDALLREKGELEDEVADLESALRTERSRKPTEPIPDAQRPADLLAQIETLTREKADIAAQRDAEQAANVLIGTDLQKRTRERNAHQARAEKAEAALGLAVGAIAGLNAQLAARPMRASTPARVSVPPPPPTTVGKVPTPPSGSLQLTTPPAAELPRWSEPPPGSRPLGPMAGTSEPPQTTDRPPARPSAAGTDNAGSGSTIHRTEPMLNLQAELASWTASATQPAGSPSPSAQTREERTTLVGVGGTDGGDLTSLFSADRFDSLLDEAGPDARPAEQLGSHLRPPTVKIRAGVMERLGAHSVDRSRFPSEAPASLSEVAGPKFGSTDPVAVPPPPRMPAIDDPDGQHDGTHENSGARKVG